MIAKLSGTEQYLWNVIQDNLDEVSRFSITQLSEFANVSAATIVRTMKKMGYRGYTDFKHQLLDKQTSPQKFENLVSADNDIKRIIMKNEIEVTNTIENLAIDVIEDAVQQAISARMVYIFARGLSESSAKELEMKLQLLDKFAQFHNDPNIIKTMAKKITKDDVVIFVTLNGNTDELVTAARSLSKNDIPIITFTTNMDSKIVPLTDFLFLGYKSAQSYFPDYEVHSRLPIEVMTRIFLDAFAVRSKQKK